MLKSRLKKIVLYDDDYNDISHAEWKKEVDRPDEPGAILVTAKVFAELRELAKAKDKYFRMLRTIQKKEKERKERDRRPCWYSKRPGHRCLADSVQGKGINARCSLHIDTLTDAEVKKLQRKLKVK